MLRASHPAPLIQVFDMPTSLHFYRDRLGFELVADSGEVDTPEGRFFHWCLLRLGGANLMLNTAYDEGERPAKPDPARQMGHADTALFFGCPDVDAAREHVREQGITAEPPETTHYGMKQLHFTDPDGYGICFQCPLCPERAG